ncbi:unannotated protein [freshwater metagenome]|uniref:Unannotated protein n=1 Tax=freshwater metagenome TaxID=449393 RepID=A0A6J6GDY1_9ZZZZ
MATTIFPVITLENVVGVTVTVNVTISPMDGEESEAVMAVVVFDTTAFAAGTPNSIIATLIRRVVTMDQEWKRLFIFNSPQA